MVLDRLGKDQGRKPVKATRAKKACDKCASAKVKCDSQEPCGRCRAKSWICEYSREGYVDPYQEYRVTLDGESSHRESASNTPVTPTSLDFVSDTVISVDLAPAVDKTQSASLQQLGCVWPSQRDLLNTSESLAQVHTDPSCGQALDMDHLNLNRMPPDMGFDVYPDPSGDLRASSWFLEPLGLVGQPMICEDLFNLEGVASRTNTVQMTEIRLTYVRTIRHS